MNWERLYYFCFEKKGHQKIITQLILKIKLCRDIKKLGGFLTEKKELDNIEELENIMSSISFF